MSQVTIPGLPLNAGIVGTELLEISNSGVSEKVAISDLSPIFQLLSLKDAANGYAGLDASSLLNVAQIPTAIPAINIADGTVDNTEFQRLNGLTSAIEEQGNKGAVSGYAGLDASQELLLANFPSGTGLQVLRRNTGNTALEFATLSDLQGITSINADTTAAQLIVGTASRITVGTAAGTTTINIDTGYVGQASITTLGTITTGVWTGTAITGANINAASTDLTDTAVIVRTNQTNVFGDFIQTFKDNSITIESPNGLTPTTIINSQQTLARNLTIPILTGNRSIVVTTEASQITIGTEVTGASTDLTDTAVIARSTNNLSFFSATTSAQLAGVISDETGSGLLVFGTSPTLITPALGTPSALVLTNATGLPPAGVVGVAAVQTDNLSVFAATTSAQLAGVISDETGTGLLVFGTSPTIVTPTIASFTNATHDHTNAAGGGQLLSTTALSDTANIVYLNTTNAYTAGTRQDFLGLLAGTAGLNVGGIVGNPTTQVNGDIWLNTSTNQIFGRINGVNIDLGAAGAGAPPFSDTTPIVEGSVDPTKEMRFEVDGLTTATTRVVSIPDADVTLVNTSDGLIADANVAGAAAIATTKLADSANFVLSNQTNTFGDFAQIFPDNQLFIQNPAATFTYQISAAGIAANRTLTLPLLTGNDIFVTEAFAQTLTNKSLALATNTITGTAAQFDTAVTDDNFAFVSDNLSVFAATTSSQLAGVISDETGTGVLVFGTAPTIDSPSINFAINAQTGTSYTFVLLDAGKVVTSSNAAAVTVTIPPNSSVAYPIGSSLTVISIGVGLTSFAQGAGVTIISTGATSSAPTLRAQNSSATAIKTATDTWAVVGDIV